jgi:hypothetical protein
MAADVNVGDSTIPDWDVAVELDLLGLVGCGELFAFETLARNSALATNLDAKSALGAMACAEFEDYRRVADKLVEMGADPEQAVGAYVPTMTQFHRKTAPRDLLEGLMKSYVGGGISSDFGREIAHFVGRETRDFVTEILDDDDQAQFVASYIQQSLREDPGSAGRLALWGRRLMGEALAQAQRVAADRPDLARLVIGNPGQGGAGLAEFGRMLAVLTEAHSERMQSLGLAP